MGARPAMSEAFPMSAGEGAGSGPGGPPHNERGLSHGCRHKVLWEKKLEGNPAGRKRRATTRSHWPVTMPRENKPRRVAPFRTPAVNPG